MEWSTITSAYPLWSDLDYYSSIYNIYLKKFMYRIGNFFGLESNDETPEWLPQIKNIICNIEIECIQEAKNRNYPVIYWSYV